MLKYGDRRMLNAMARALRVSAGIDSEIGYPFGTRAWAPSGARRFSRAGGADDYSNSRGDLPRAAKQMLASIVFDKRKIIARDFAPEPMFGGAAAARVAAGAPREVGVPLEKVDRVHGLDGWCSDNG
jgi:hypothetical protein